MNEARFTGTDKLRRDARSHDGGECRGHARHGRCSSRASPARARRSSPRRSRARCERPLYEWHIKSTSKAQQGLYEYDAVSRLRDSQLGDEKVRDIRNYIVKGSLWEAFESAVQPVLLIDEIDKADIEFPNDLLRELDRMEFYVNETRELVKARHRPDHPHHQQQREGTAGRVPAPLLLPLHPVSRTPRPWRRSSACTTRISSRSCCAKR